MSHFQLSSLLFLFLIFLCQFDRAGIDSFSIGSEKKGHIYVFFVFHHRFKGMVNRLTGGKKYGILFKRIKSFKDWASKVLLERVWRRKKDGGCSGSLSPLYRPVCHHLGHCSEAHLFSSQVIKVCGWSSWNPSQLPCLCPCFQVAVESFLVIRPRREQELPPFWESDILWVHSYGNKW